MEKSAIVTFYLREGPDDRGRMIDEIWKWNETRLEDTHDYIQWLFPLKERSAFNPGAPVLTDADIAALKANVKANYALLFSFARLLVFYGFTPARTGEELRIARGPEFALRARSWLTPGNHNFLRVTRILKSLMLLGQEKAARAFLAALEDVYREYGDTIGEETLAYWRNAVRI